MGDSPISHKDQDYSFEFVEGAKLDNCTVGVVHIRNDQGALAGKRAVALDSKGKLVEMRKGQEVEADKIGTATLPVLRVLQQLSEYLPAEMQLKATRVDVANHMFSREPGADAPTHFKRWVAEDQTTRPIAKFLPVPELHQDWKLAVRSQLSPEGEVTGKVVEAIHENGSFVAYRMGFAEGKTQEIEKEEVLFKDAVLPDALETTMDTLAAVVEKDELRERDMGEIEHAADQAAVITDAEMTVEMLNLTNMRRLTERIAEHQASGNNEEMEGGIARISAVERERCRREAARKEQNVPDR